LVIFICNIILVSYFFIGKVISSIKSQIDHTVLSTI
jgi:hypothetical protein